MLSNRQCELARLMTGTLIADEEINKEFHLIDSFSKKSAIQEIEKLLVMHDKPFDIGFSMMKEDFFLVAEKYNIAPATLFCVYMEK